ncbi:MAG TPA: hypothetical protein VG944_00460 [Fimbriimonas sp.]|nr:hypothetical protein [Fimbriimonas sp.]
MPVEFAKRIAAVIAQDHTETMTVDLHNDGFSDAVAKELEKLGFEVQRFPTKPHRLKIIRKPSDPSQDSTRDATPFS